jgi:helicase required for RNAi-mediated heterochromatin assembly 1
VALSTSRDNFNTICRVATVIQRFVTGGLEPDTKAGEPITTPPRIDIAWADPDDAVLDPAEHMVMIEAKAGYYESVRHTMRGLQLWSNKE